MVGVSCGSLPSDRIGEGFEGDADEAAAARGQDDLGPVMRGDPVAEAPADHGVFGKAQIPGERLGIRPKRDDGAVIHAHIIHSVFSLAIPFVSQDVLFRIYD